MRLPNRPSCVWFGIALLYLATSCTYHFSTKYERALATQNGQELDWLAPNNPRRFLEYFSHTCFLGGFAIFCLGRKQRDIEERRILPKEHSSIDEIGLRISHYFKMQEAIWSPSGNLVFAMSFVKAYFAVRALWEPSLSAKTIALYVLMAADMACLSVIMLRACIALPMFFFYSCTAHRYPYMMFRLRFFLATMCRRGKITQPSSFDDKNCFYR